ncbi:uncharacterized protein EI97DRAFT_86128 [Westerdykella ornata]|uniref:Uncharacterized protein n=1 Tax=Westerdykella ornata TaxID=318751 RepID=A0A6A6JFE2_WESOR|nr:uncharacterized protein EI97DRAFT_86128 [Westerdykella ornata]KAF2275047.1 hypothetical protein EI97DRAFT_86128 [Westerdykella ornata]
MSRRENAAAATQERETQTCPSRWLTRRFSRLWFPHALPPHTPTAATTTTISCNGHCCHTALAPGLRGLQLRQQQQQQQQQAGKEEEEEEEEGEGEGEEAPEHHHHLQQQQQSKSASSTPRGPY